MSESGSIAGLLIEFSEKLKEYETLRNQLMLYYDGKLALDEIILYLRSNNFCSPTNRYKFIDFLKISIYYEKNKQLLLAIRQEITQTFTKNELFAIFNFRYKSLRFLLANDFISIHTLQMNMTKRFFVKFLPELKAKATTSYIQKYSSKNDLQKYVETLDLYMESKKLGYSPSILKQIIKADDLEEFLSFINSVKVDFDQKLKPRFEYKTGLLPIEYVVQKGAVNIFKYLVHHEAKIPLDIMDKAIEGGNIEIIHILNDKGIEFSPRCLSLAIEFHNDVLYNHMHNTLGFSNDIDQLMTSIKSFNLKVLEDILKERSDLFEDVNKFPIIFCAICEHEFMMMFTFFYQKIVPLFTKPIFDINYKHFSAILLSIIFLLHSTSFSIILLLY